MSTDRHRNMGGTRLGAAAVREVRYALTALGYFTRVPVPKWVGFEPHYLQAAARWFPFVGLLVGAVSAAVYLVCAQWFMPGVAVLLSMAASLLMTGAFHEDGLADCCDAFWGGYSREDVLRIMHDSRIGAFGAIGLVISLALKWQALTALSVSHVSASASVSGSARVAVLLIAAHAASRAVAISYVRDLDYVRAEGKAKPVVRRLGVGSLVWVMLTGLPWIFWPDWRLGALTLVLLAVIRLALGRWFARRIGGYTGDCLGFAQQIFEITLYLTALAWVAR
ncbi:adenosylcobinamide-GDP ribazoletransferase [Pararobbsia alpina]|uniref:adenosylcobinamide-GDP ribazoletransferase n=1 Tax=Pararobbsia alpina TaxID=621374 RepID=UPI0039A57FDC